MIREGVINNYGTSTRVSEIHSLRICRYSFFLDVRFLKIVSFLFISSYKS
jgi:hypothetical protein